MQREQVLRDAADGKTQQINSALQELKETRGQFTSQLQAIQADPALLQVREAKRAALDEAHAAQESASKELERQEATIRQHRAEVQHLEQVRRQLAEQRRKVDEEQAQLQHHLDADAGTLLGFLRQNHTNWTGHIAKLIKPELLLRDDLVPALIGREESFYGLGLSLELLSADRSASEATLREALAACRAELDRLSREERRFDDKLADHQKTGQALDKQWREFELALGQWRRCIKQLKEESASLDLQIEASRRERRQLAESRLHTLESELTVQESALARQQTEWAEVLRTVREDVSSQLEEIGQQNDEQTQRLQNEIYSARPQMRKNILI